MTFSGPKVRFASKEDDVVMVGDRVGKTLYLFAISPRNHSKQQMDDAFQSYLSLGLTTCHRRLTHANYKTIIKMASKDLVDRLDLANNDIPSHPGTGCAFGKHQQSPFKTGRNRAKYTSQWIHSDLCGLIEKAMPNGALYFSPFIDDFSGWRFIYFLKKKSETTQRFMDLFCVIRSETENLVRIFRTDGGS